jgi:hypothetical protein
MKYTFHVKFQLFVTAKSEDPDTHGLAPWIRMRIEVKSWIRIHIETSADPKHCFKELQKMTG